MHESGHSSPGSDRTPESVYSEEDVALIESIGSSLAVTGSARDLPSTSGTREEGNLHPEGKVEVENFLMEGLTSPSLDRRLGEIPPAAVPNTRQGRSPRWKRRNWCSSALAQTTVITLFLGTAAFTAKMRLSLGSPTFDMTDRDIQKEGRDNGTAHSDTSIRSTMEPPNQPQLVDTGVSDVQRTHVENESRLIPELSSTQPMRSTCTDRHLASHSSTTTDGAPLVIKHNFVPADYCSTVFGLNWCWTVRFRRSIQGSY